jgi:hypothetical protein
MEKIRKIIREQIKIVEERKEKMEKTEYVP